MPAISIFFVPLPHHCCLRLGEQRAVLQGIARGCTEKMIDRDLRVSPSRIKQVVRRVAENFGASSREETLVRASLFGVVGWSYKPEVLRTIDLGQKVSPADPRPSLRRVR